MAFTVSSLGSTIQGDDVLQSSDTWTNRSIPAGTQAVVVAVTYREGSGSGRVTSVTAQDSGGGNPELFEKIGSIQSGGNAIIADLWYLVDPISGTRDFEFVWSENINDSYYAAAAITAGLDTADALDASDAAVNSGGVSAPSVPLTTASDNAAVFCVFTTDADMGPFTPPTGWTELADLSGGTNAFGDNDTWFGWIEAGSAGPVTCDPTADNPGNWAAVIASFKAGAGGEPTPETYTYAGTGGADFGGTAPRSRTKAAAVAGGASFGGTAPRSRTKAHLATGGIQVSGTAVTSVNDGPTEYIYTPTGGMLYAGAAPISKDKAFLPTGGIQFAGAIPAPVRTKAYQPTGGLVFDGDATLARTRDWLPEGGLAFGGIALTDGPGEKDTRGRSRQLVGIGHLMNS